jgi:hypothetical protein
MDVGMKLSPLRSTAAYVKWSACTTLRVRLNASRKSTCLSGAVNPPITEFNVVTEAGESVTETVTPAVVEIGQSALRIADGGSDTAEDTANYFTPSNDASSNSNASCFNVLNEDAVSLEIVRAYDISVDADGGSTTSDTADLSTPSSDASAESTAFCFGSLNESAVSLEIS